MAAGGAAESDGTGHGFQARKFEVFGREGEVDGTESF